MDGVKGQLRVLTPDFSKGAEEYLVSTVFGGKRTSGDCGNGYVEEQAALKDLDIDMFVDVRINGDMVELELDKTREPCFRKKRSYVVKGGKLHGGH